VDASSEELGIGVEISRGSGDAGKAGKVINGARCACGGDSRGDNSGDITIGKSNCDLKIALGSKCDGLGK
jgi:hypothetical protein